MTGIVAKNVFYVDIMASAVFSLIYLLIHFVFPGDKYN